MSRKEGVQPKGVRKHVKYNFGGVVYDIFLIYDWNLTEYFSKLVPGSWVFAPIFITFIRYSKF